MFFLLSITLANIKCNTFFCYKNKESDKEWELTGFAENFKFADYGATHSEPLDLSVGTEGDILTSINTKFPSAVKKFTLIIPNTPYTQYLDEFASIQ